MFVVRSLFAANWTHNLQAPRKIGQCLAKALPTSLKNVQERMHDVELPRKIGQCLAKALPTSLKNVQERMHDVELKIFQSALPRAGKWERGWALKSCSNIRRLGKHRIMFVVRSLFAANWTHNLQAPRKIGQCLAKALPTSLKNVQERMHDVELKIFQSALPNLLNVSHEHWWSKTPPVKMTKLQRAPVPKTDGGC